jgi:hypothetical protein
MVHRLAAILTPDEALNCASRPARQDAPCLAALHGPTLGRTFEQSVELALGGMPMPSAPAHE